MNDTLSNTPGKRESMTVNGLITKEKTRNNNLKDIYEIIQETGWFTKEEVHAKYKFKGVNGDIIGNQQLRNVFDDAIELGLFESKYMNVVILNGGARRTYYTKVVEGKDIDLKSLKDKVNLDNEKVRAARLTDKDYLAKQAKRASNQKKSTSVEDGGTGGKPGASDSVTLDQFVKMNMGEKAALYAKTPDVYSAFIQEAKQKNILVK